MKLASCCAWEHFILNISNRLYLCSVISLECQLDRSFHVQRIHIRLPVGPFFVVYLRIVGVLYFSGCMLAAAQPRTTYTEQLNAVHALKNVNSSFFMYGSHRRPYRTIYVQSGPKISQQVFVISASDSDWLSKFFHWHTRIKDPCTPEMRRVYSATHFRCARNKRIFNVILIWELNISIMTTMMIPYAEKTRRTLLVTFGAQFLHSRLLYVLLLIRL